MSRRMLKVTRFTNWIWCLLVKPFVIVTLEESLEGDLFLKPCLYVSGAR